MERDRQALLRLAERRRLDVQTLAVCGIHLAVTRAASGGRTVTASGAGFEAEDAAASCLGEAAEFFSWQWRAEDCVRIVADQPDTATRIDPRPVLGFSESQVGRRDRLNKAWDGFDRIPPATFLDSPEVFVRAENFDGTAHAACPAFLAFGGYGSKCGDATLDGDSNGCAAGPTFPAARARALLELVERDAAGLWWHRGLSTPRYERSRVTDPVLREAVEAHCRETGRRLWYLDISVFRAASVFAAVSCEDDGTRAMFGFGCASGATSAARTAFCELVQGEVALDAYEERRAQGRPMTPVDRRIGKWLRRADIRRMRFAVGAESDWPARPRESVEAIFAEIRAAVGEPWFVDLTRPDIGIPAAKAIVAGMAHFKPRHGVPRLSDPALEKRATRIPPGVTAAHKLLI